MTADPVRTDPDKYRVTFENDRVLEYRDLPGDKTHPHRHTDSVMYTLSAFQRRLHVGQDARDVVMEGGRAGERLGHLRPVPTQTPWWSTVRPGNG